MRLKDSHVDDVIQLLRELIKRDQQYIKMLEPKKGYWIRQQDYKNSLENTRESINIMVLQLARWTRFKNEKRMINKGMRFKTDKHGSFLITKVRVGIQGHAEGYTVQNEQTKQELYRSRKGLEEAIQTNKIKLL